MAAGTTQAFTDEAVPQEDVQTILRAGLASESAINQQPWHLVAITNKEVIAELSSSGGMPTGGPMPTPPQGGGTMPIFIHTYNDFRNIIVDAGNKRGNRPMARKERDTGGGVCPCRCAADADSYERMRSISSVRSFV